MADITRSKLTDIIDGRVPFRIRPGNSTSAGRVRPRKRKSKKRELPPVVIDALGRQVHDAEVGFVTKKQQMGKPLAGGREWNYAEGRSVVRKQRSGVGPEEYRARLRALGITQTDFANRIGMSRQALGLYLSKPLVQMFVVRLLEFEEFMAGIAVALDAPTKPGSNTLLRKAVTSVLTKQIDRLPPLFNRPPPKD